MNTPLTPLAGQTRPHALDDMWGKRYPAMIQLWGDAWSEFIPFLELRCRDPESHLLDERHRYLEPLAGGL